MANLAENSLFTFNPFIGNFNDYGDGAITTDSYGTMFRAAKDENDQSIWALQPVTLTFAPSVHNDYAEIQWQYIYCRKTYNIANAYLSSPSTNLYLLVDHQFDALSLYVTPNPFSTDLQNAYGWCELTNEDGHLRVLASDMKGWNLVFENTTEGTTTAICGTSNQQSIDFNDFRTFVGAYKITQSQGEIYTTYGEAKYNDGYNAGKADGIAETNGTLNGFNVIGQAFDGVGGFLSKELLPGISFGTLISVPILVTLIAVIIRILKK